jgi:hypothetical protein
MPQSAPRKRLQPRKSATLQMSAVNSFELAELGELSQCVQGLFSRLHATHLADEHLSRHEVF